VLDSLILQNFLSPPILFFFLGALAVVVGSDLEIPQPLPRLFSLYLLFAIGFHGGVALSEAGLQPRALVALGAAMLMAVVVPLYAFALLRLRFNTPDAAAIAATYGSISAVTFITAGSFLNLLNIPYGGHMVAAMALMESPAVIIGVMLARRSVSNGVTSRTDLVKEAFVNGSVFLILGSLAIGLATGERGRAALLPFTDEIFTGMLAFFLLDMGIVAARRLRALQGQVLTATAYAIGLPIVNAAGGLLLAALLSLPPGDAVLFVVLCASASYIAVPAAMRQAVPEANPSLYVSMALGITFPFNIIIGLPVYAALVRTIWSSGVI
jgi:uncharacterized protein